MVTAIWLHAMAIALGNYPLPWQEAYRRHGMLDTPSHGLARALGFADEAAMHAGADADPTEWGLRLDLAHTALVERFGGNTQNGFELVCRALDRIAYAKAHGVACEPKLEFANPEAGLHRAMVHFGVSADALASAEYC